MHVTHGVEEFLHLQLPRAHNAGIRMAGSSDAKCRGQVEVFAAIGVLIFLLRAGKTRTWPFVRASA